jgi:stalled ribosome rescue protein Dom34
LAIFSPKKIAIKDQITLEKQKFPNFEVKTMTKCVEKKKKTTTTMLTSKGYHLHIPKLVYHD